MRTTCNIIVSTHSQFARRGEYARGEHYIECLVDECLPLKGGELVAHGKAHLCTGELPDDISYDFYKALKVTVRYSKEQAKWVAITAWEDEWQDEKGNPMSDEIKSEMAECFGMMRGECQAVIDFDEEAQRVADNLEFFLYVNGLTGAEKLAFVNGWSLEGGPLDWLGYEGQDCTPWTGQNTISVSAFEVDFIPRTAEEWGRAFFLEKKAEIVHDLACWYRGASEDERAKFANEHPWLVRDVKERENGFCKKEPRR